MKRTTTCILLVALILMLAVTALPYALCYPPAGFDTMDTRATVNIVITSGPGLEEIVTVKGPTTVSRGEPHDGGDGHDVIETEIVSMKLVGTSDTLGHITIDESPTKQSKGLIRQQVPGEDFPADSFFDVYVEIKTEMPSPMSVLHNNNPVPMFTTIYKIPPILSVYISPPQPIPLYNELGGEVGYIKHVEHMIDPPPDLFGWGWKHNYTDYAPSGVPDFDQRQMPHWQGTGTWSWCAPTAAANSLSWMDSRFESSATPPPATNDTFPLVSPYGPWDDHDPNNTIPLIDHLGYLMDTDGVRTGIAHIGTTVNDTQAGITHYLSWTGVNPQGDVNGDGVVNMTDSNIVAAALGSSVVGGVPSPTWNMAADIWPATTGWPNIIMADNTVDMNDALLVAANMNSTGMFYEKTVKAPEFYFIEEEVERCEDVILVLGFYYGIDREEYPYPYGSGHMVTVAGVNSTLFQIALSDPIQDNAEPPPRGTNGPGRVLPPPPHPHLPVPPYPLHNNATYVSQDIYNVTLAPPGIPANFSLLGYSSPQFPGALAMVEWAVIVSPIEEAHDVAIKAVVPHKTIVGQGYGVRINVTVTNEGDFAESCNVTAYANTTSIQTLNVTNISPGSSSTITFYWNTTGFTKGNYTIIAQATVVGGETDTADNSFFDGTVRVNMRGDVAPEYGLVDIVDIVYVAIHFGSQRGDPNYEPNADLNCDGIIDIVDIVIVAIHFGETDP